MSLVLEQVVIAANEVLEENGWDYHLYELVDDEVHIHYKKFIGNGKWEDADEVVGTSVKDVIDSITGLFYQEGFQNG